MKLHYVATFVWHITDVDPLQPARAASSDMARRGLYL